MKKILMIVVVMMPLCHHMHRRCIWVVVSAFGETVMPM